jgi:hypothetical protein
MAANDDHVSLLDSKDQIAEYWSVNAAIADLTLDDNASPGLWRRLFSEFPASVDEWSRCISRLNQWENEHLLVENPEAEALAHHRTAIGRLMFFGQAFAFVATHPEYGDAPTAEIVTSSQEVLRNKLRMFHHPVSREEADKILSEVFPAS